MKVKIGKYPRHRWYHNYLYKWFGYEQKRSVSVHIDSWDTWAMDSTLAHIVAPMLKQLKETQQGAPFVDDEDVPEELKSTPKENEWDTDDNHFKRWDWVINEMIFAFESKLEDWDDKFYKYEDDPAAPFGIKLVWSDDEGMAAHKERMANGFRLFGKFYEALWD